MSQPVKRRRGVEPVDLSTFTAQVDAALAAFGTDVSYAVSMARAAVVIGRKRRIWQARRELREAEAHAQAQCRATADFDCHAVCPCGVGDCKFAAGPHAALVLPPCPGPTNRPQIRSTGGYSIEPAVTALADRRRGPL